LSGWDAVGVGRAGDLAEALASRVCGIDSFDHRFENLPRAASECWCGARLAGPLAFGEEAFELVDRYQLRAPRHLDRLDIREDSPNEGGGADAERLGGMATRVGEPLDASPAERLLGAGLKVARRAAP
jgi:hypothetical protein